MTLIVAIRDRAERARESMARDLFDWEKVLERIKDVANRGSMDMVIVPALAVELSKTVAAAALVEKLKEYGFRTHWVKRRPELSAERALLGRGEGPLPEVSALEIRWDVVEHPKPT